jgi:hypothetical protein
MFVKVQCWRDFFILAVCKLGATFCLPSTSKGLQNLVERKLIVNGCGRAVSKFVVRSSNVALVGSTQRQDLRQDLLMNLSVGEQAERLGQSRQLFARMFVTAIELGAVETMS